MRNVMSRYGLGLLHLSICRAKRQEVVGSAKLSQRRCVEDMAGSSRANSELGDCRQAEKKTCLYGSHHRGVLCASGAEDCAVLIGMSLAAREMLSYRVLDKKMKKPEKKAPRNKAELAKKIRS